MYKNLAVFLLAALLAAPAALAAETGGLIKVGQPLPSTALEAPQDPAQRAYLGLRPGQGLDPAALKARLVIVEFLDTGCPGCRLQAPKVNRLYELIQARGWDAEVKLLGVGINNTAQEVEGFVKDHQVPFPMVADRELKSLKLVGAVYLPYFVAIGRQPSGEMRVLCTVSRRLPPPEEFLAELAAQAGLK